MLFWVGILLFSSKIGARRQIKFKYNTDKFIANLRLFSNEIVEKIPHPDTLAYLFDHIPYNTLDNLRHEMINQILRKKALVKWRLLNQFYLISIDGTGYLDFRYKHCDGCLTRKLNDGSIYYHHPVLDAKLVTGNGLSLSIGTEFMQNIPGRDKQDCELLAFYRWAKKFKKMYPQLKICLLLDGLYARRPVFWLCKKYDWKYIIVLKEGAQKDLYNWYEIIRDKGEEKNHKEIIFKDMTQHYRWISPFEHFTGETFHVFECLEESSKEKNEKWVWITNIEVTEENVHKLGNGGGRLRWKAENEGFNSQKNGGYEMEHAYSHHPNGMKCFYLLLQIAHLIDQLVEKGSLLVKHGIDKIGSIRNVAFFLLESLRTSLIDTTLLGQRIQIRLNSG